MLVEASAAPPPRQLTLLLKSSHSFHSLKRDQAEQRGFGGSRSTRRCRWVGQGTQL